MAGDDPLVCVDEVDAPHALRRPLRRWHHPRPVDDVRFDLVDPARSIGQTIDREGKDQQRPHLARIGGGTQVLVAIAENLQVGVGRGPLRLLVRHDVVRGSGRADWCRAEPRVDPSLADRGLAAAIVRIARVVAGKCRIADVTATVEMADFVREGVLVADETATDAVVSPAAAGVARTLCGQRACLGHYSVDDVGDVEQGSKQSCDLEAGQQVDPRGILQPPGLGVPSALRGGPEKSPDLVSSTPRIVVSK